MPKNMLKDTHSPYDPDNIFAKILREEIPCKKIYEDDYALCFHDVTPQAPVHALVIPKGAYRSFSDFTANASDEKICGFFRAVKQSVLLLNLEKEGYRLLANHGEHAGQEVPHFHIHICGGGSLGRLISKQ